jgi:excisionase family DNA binding protein
MEDDPLVGLRPDQVVVKLEDDRPQGVIDTPTIGHNAGPPVDDRAAGIPIQKLAFSVAEAATSAALSRSLLYEFIREGDLKSFRVRGRRRRLIYVDDLRAWLLSQRAAASETDPVRRNPDAAQDGAAPTRSFEEKQ